MSLTSTLQDAGRYRQTYMFGRRPMLAPGGSAIAAIQYLRGQGVKDIRLLVIIAAPEGIKAVLDADENVRLFTCSIDERLNERAYIVPGLGDAGDRIFGTK